MFFKVPITFHGDSIQYAALGESVTIKCHVQASPAAEVSWFKGQEKTRIGLLKKLFSIDLRLFLFIQMVRITHVLMMVYV